MDRLTSGIGRDANVVSEGKRVGIDADFINVNAPKDLEYTMKILVPGSTIEAYVVPMWRCRLQAARGGKAPAPRRAHALTLHQHSMILRTQ